MDGEEQAGETAPIGKPVTQLEAHMNSLRAQLLAIEKEARLTAEFVDGEAHAQAWLAVRHIEDARMRLGKVIQYAVGGGVSCWDSGRKPGDDGR